MKLKEKEFVEHCSGLFVAKDGEVFMDIKCKRFPTGNFTYGNTNNSGYKVVRYKGKRYYVHRLVAECYLPNPEILPTVDHIDRNPSNNNVENLRWSSYNMQNYNRDCPKNTASSKPVLQYTPEGELVREWPSVSECGRNGFNKCNVSSCCKGIYEQHKGYIFKYKNEELEQI